MTQRRLAAAVVLCLGLMLPPGLAGAGLVILDENGNPVLPPATDAPAVRPGELPEAFPAPDTASDPDETGVEAALAGMGLDVEGLDSLLTLPDLPPPSCDGTAGVTRAILVAADAPTDTWRLTGPKNDVEILANSLVARGADPANLVSLTDADATRAGLERAVAEMLPAVGCRDSVILHFSAYVRDRQSGIGEWILLNPEAADTVSLLRADAVAALAVAFRNRGADVSVILDGDYAEGFAIEARQHGLIGEEVAGSRYRLNDSAEPAPPAGARVPAGNLTVFYSSEAGGHTPEVDLPKDSADQKTYGLMTFYLATALLETEAATPPALMRQLRRNDSLREIADRGSHNFVFFTTDPDMRIVAEERRADDRDEGTADWTETIRIISPEPMRDAKPLDSSEIEIRGKVESMEETLIVLVNGEEAVFDGSGDFRHAMELQAGVNKVQVLALTRSNRPVTLSFELYYEGDVKALLGSGQRYALLIANQDYAEGSGLRDLKTPIGDAEAVAAALARFGYVTQAVSADGASLDLFLRNPDRLQIETALYELGRIAGEKDSVLIFYAGHGNYEEATGKASWLAADASAGRPFTWLSADAISDAILRMDAGSVLLISDSCYSGALLRGGPDLPAIEDKDRLLQLQRMAAKRSRILISSGANEPVLDGGGGGHSVFAAALLAGLEGMEEDAFTAAELFAGQILPKVVARAPQEPQFRPIERSGHEGGDVVLVRQGG